jgi:hypothetical protein
MKAKPFFSSVLADLIWIGQGIEPVSYADDVVLFLRPLCHSAWYLWALHRPQDKLSKVQSNLFSGCYFKHADLSIKGVFGLRNQPILDEVVHHESILKI